MPISSEGYAALEAAVGKRFVSKEPAFIFGVQWNGASGLQGEHGPLVPAEAMPVAVVMPSTVEEVAAVVKACRRYNLNFKPFSVGWLGFAAAMRPNTVTIDLRRMDFCEIDERNMIATIGPYVTAGQLMVEAMKKGLTCHVVGAGPTHSPLASATSLYGIGVSGTSTGHNARNLLSLEWVTPEGEIVRIGSAGSGLSWGISDGPGPGFRGMIRGFIGAAGGLGVFTRIGYRLHPWHGPKKLEYTGQHPQVGMKIGENFVRFYHAMWPTWEDVEKATFEFNASAVATVQLRMPPESIGWTLTSTNNEYLQQHERNELPAIARQETGCGWSIVTTAYSQKNDAYNDKVVRHIVERTGGKFIEVAQEHAELMARAYVTSAYVPRVMRPTDKLNTSFGVFDSFKLLPRAIKATEDAYKEHDIAPKHFHSVGAEQNWIWPTERRTFWTENIMAGASDSMPAMFEYLFRHEQILEERRLGYQNFLVGPAMDVVGPRWGPNSQDYIRKVKNTYDPQNLSEPFMYIPAQPTPGSQFWPLVKRFIYRPGFRPLLKKVVASQVPQKKKT